jgi:hypothetical protein
MSILAKLSSQRGDRSETSNRKAVILCLEDPTLLEEIAAGLKEKNAALVGDCAEVLTQVAEQHPERVAPYAQELSALLSHKTTRVRWEAMHALALVTTFTPETIAPLLQILSDLIQRDTSTIVRDYAVDSIGYYAATSKSAAETAYPLLKEALSVWGDKHAGHALKGLANVATQIPALQDELHKIAEEYSQSSRAVVRKEAKELLKAIKQNSRPQTNQHSNPHCLP